MVRADGGITMEILRTEATEWLRHETPDDIVVQRQQPEESTVLKLLREQLGALTSNMQAMQSAMTTLSERVHASVACV